MRGAGLTNTATERRGYTGGYRAVKRIWIVLVLVSFVEK